MPKTAAPQGVMPAVVTPFKPDGNLDERALARYVNHVVAIDGVTGILCNGYTGEGGSLDRAEKVRVIETCAREIGGRVPLFAGVETPSTRTAIQLGTDAREAGATGIQVNSPFYNFIRRGFLSDSEASVTFFRTLDSEVGLPMTLFQYPRSTGLTYSPQILQQLAEIENVVGIKEAVDLDTFIDDHDAVHGKISIIADNNTYTLLAMLFYGADASMVGISNVGTHLFTQLWTAAKTDRSVAVDLMNERIVPLINAFSRNLGNTSWSLLSRVKEALVMLDLIPSATVRGPDLPATEGDRRVVKEALTTAGLLG